ncbi:MAG: pilus assembly protein PilP [Immundisolibacter sp.]|uniref:pilus assembly protein PilP n=1 Tax=Immundisolibacter sp. TaxID=1934948 RepID=UPI003D096CD1
MSGGRTTLIGLTCLVLAGCSSKDAELKTWMDQVRAEEKVTIEPLPVLKPYEPFVYKRDELKDPFLDTLTEQKTENVADAGLDGVRPDLNRRKEALEAYPLDALRMVGTLARGDSLWALIQAPDQTISRVSVGNYLGENYGRITDVADSRVNLMEMIPNGTGGWTERPAAVEIVEQ